MSDRVVRNVVEHNGMKFDPPVSMWEAMRLAKKRPAKH